MKGFVIKNKLTVSILLSLIIFLTIHMHRPALFYNEEGSFRPFGVGYRHKTVIPIWLFSIFIAILSYMSVLYYLAYL